MQETLPRATLAWSYFGLNAQLMLLGHSALYKNTNNEVAIATIIFNRVIAPEGEILSFAQPLESIQRKAARLQLNLRSSVLLGVGREGFLPSYRRAASMPRRC